MTKRDDISSTEKLLDAIRNKPSDTDIDEETIELPAGTETSEDELELENTTGGDIPITKDEMPSPSFAPPGGTTPKAPVFPETKPRKMSNVSKPKKGSKESTVVGLTISHHDICMVMVNRLSVNNRELLNYKKIRYPDGLTQESKEFPDFLQVALFEFLRPYPDSEIWVVVPSESLENRYFTIPKVPEAKIKNAVYWTFKKEVPFDESESIFDFEILGEIIEDNAKKIQISAYIVDRVVVEGAKALFEDIHLPLFGISVAPFTFQNFFRLKWAEPDTEKLCTVNMGLEYSRIDIFSNGDLIMSRNVKTGIDSMIGAIREDSDDIIRFDGLEEEDEGPVLEIENFNEGSVDNEVSVDIDDGDIEISSEDDSYIEDIDADHALEDIINKDYHDARLALIEFTNQHDEVYISPKKQKIDDTIFELILPVIERLVRQIERTFEYYSRIYKTSGPEKVIFSGEVSTYKRLTEYIGTQLGLPTGLVDPFDSNRQLTQTVTPPRNQFERESMSKAYGLALSDVSHTPNLIYTHDQKTQEKKVKQVNVALFATFFVLVFICCGALFGLFQTKSAKQSEIKKLQASLDSFNPKVNQKMLQNLYAELQNKKRIMKKYAINCLGTAIVTELTQKTPHKVKLTKIDAKLNSPKDKNEDGAADESTARKKKRKIKIKQLTIKGYVDDSPMALESTLAGYLVDINSSPIFGKVTIRSKSIVIMEDNEVLSFTAIVEII